MESIKNGLNPNSLLLSQMQSNAAVKKISANPHAEESANVGNLLGDFGSILKDQMSHINALQSEANASMETYATGGDIELHNVILAVEKADMALQLAMQVRNKVVSAYQEITRMGI